MRFPVALLCLLLLALSGVAAQTTPDPAPVLKLTDTPLPKDPAAALDLLRKTNGLGDDTKPWHVHATYETFDEQGKPAGTGTFEMWWAGPTKYKQVILSDSFKQTQWGTENGVLQIGYEFTTPFPEAFLVSTLLHPLPAPSEQAGTRLDARELSLGSMKLGCAIFNDPQFPDPAPSLGFFPTYCFDKDKPILRTVLQNAIEQISRNQLILFRNEYLAKQVTVSEQSRPLMSISVDLVETMPPLEDAFFVPPPDSQPLRPRFDLASTRKRPDGLLLGRLRRGVDPVYPPVARAKKIQTEVTLDGTVTRDGHVRDVTLAVIPNPDFALSAIEAVRKYLLEPCTYNGQPTEVRLHIVMNYKLY